MLLAILATCSPEELEGMEDEDDDDEHTVDLALPPSERRQQIKNKILAVGKMQRVFQLLRWVVNVVALSGHRLCLSFGVSMICHVTLPDPRTGASPRPCIFAINADS
jgi:hypothetical protein